MFTPPVLLSEPGFSCAAYSSILKMETGSCGQWISVWLHGVTSEKTETFIVRAHENFTPHM